MKDIKFENGIMTWSNCDFCNCECNDWEKEHCVRCGESSVKIMNCTPHNVVICDNDGKVIVTIPASGTVARCTTSQTHIADVGFIPVMQKEFGEVVELPEQDGETTFIVSSIVASALKRKRDDIVVPNDTVRNEQGQIVGCKNFARI